MLKTKKNKLITLSAASFILLFTLAFLVSVTTKDSEHAENPQETDNLIGFSETTSAEEIGAIPTSETTRRPSANSVPRTTAPPLETMAENPPEEVEIMLAPVFVPDNEVRVILEERNVEVAPVIPPTPQTQPAPEEQHATNEVTYIDGQKYVWNNVLGWVKDSGDGYVIIMDVESNGEMYDGGW